MCIGAGLTNKRSECDTGDSRAARRKSAQRRLPSLLRASLTARVLRSIVSWEGIARIVLLVALAGLLDCSSPFDWRARLRVALAFAVARRWRGLQYLLESLGGCVKPRPRFLKKLDR